jgi:hypothetical protein
LAAAGYVAFEEAFLAAAMIPDPEYAGLRETATGETLGDVTGQLRAWQLSGRAVRQVGPPGQGIRVLNSSVRADGTAVVRSCAVDDDHVVIADSGQVVNDDVVTRLVDVTLIQESARWKVSQIRVAERWEGVAGCAVNF